MLDQRELAVEVAERLGQDPAPRSRLLGAGELLAQGGTRVLGGWNVSWIADQPPFAAETLGHVLFPNGYRVLSQDLKSPDPHLKSPGVVHIFSLMQEFVKAGGSREAWEAWCHLLIQANEFITVE